MTFRVGQLVVCADDGPSEKYCNWKIVPRTGDWVVKGGIYTVAGFHVYAGVPALVLEEIKNGPWKEYPEIGYAAARFRPVVTPSIEVFQAMLTPSKQRERV